jgi:hypothetical protein
MLRSASVAIVKIIYTAENIIDANLVKAALAEDGIESFIAGEYLTGAIGQLPAWDIVKVMVSDIDVERALPIAEAVDRDLRQHREQHGADIAFAPAPQPG